MFGAILGDMIGAPYEFDMGGKTKDFPLFSTGSQFTDDTVMTIAVAEALMDHGNEDDAAIRAAVVRSMRAWGRRYPDAGYGGMFYHWLHDSDPQPYGSYGNGSAMRVSPAGWLYDTVERTRHVAKLTAEVTHNHPEGIKGAEATASAIFLARTGHDKRQIRDYIIREFHYDLSRTCDEIRPWYHHVESCQQTVPEAITAFLEGTSFEDVLRTAVSLGGDCDTLTDIAGGIAEAFYGITTAFEEACLKRLPEDMAVVLNRFDAIRRHAVPRENEPAGNRIELSQGDITTLNVDAIVNAANETLLGGGGVDGAIHRAAGPDLLKECRTLNGCRTGEAKITRGYRLKAKYVIHTVGPVYSGTARDADLLAACYRNSLALARRHDVHTIAFPAISTGAYGYPAHEAARVALNAISRWLDENRDYRMIVTICCFNQKTLEAYQALA